MIVISLEWFSIGRDNIEDPFEEYSIVNNYSRDDENPLVNCGSVVWKQRSHGLSDKPYGSRPAVTLRGLLIESGLCVIVSRVCPRAPRSVIQIAFSRATQTRMPSVISFPSSQHHPTETHVASLPLDVDPKMTRNVSNTSEIRKLDQG